MRRVDLFLCILLLCSWLQGCGVTERAIRRFRVIKCLRSDC